MKLFRKPNKTTKNEKELLDESRPPSIATSESYQLKNGMLIEEVENGLADQEQEGSLDHSEDF